ncbi:MAG: alpha-mannosidase [Clostridia bacterium]|nr:alpha-mannosidase [Clostridia bacterium]
MNYLQERIEQVLGWVHQRTVMDHVRVENISYVPCDYKGVGHVAPTDGWKPQTTREDLAAGIPAGGSKTAYGEYHAWFKATVTIPESMKGQHVELMVHSPRHSNPQYIVYMDGKIVQGVDGNHQSFPIDSTVDSFELTVYGFSGRPAELFLTADLQLIDTDTRALYYDLKVPYDVMRFLPFEGKEYCEIRTALNETINLIDFRERGSDEYHASVKAALDYIRTEFYEKKCGKQMANVVCIGHSHIDTAWLWPFRQTEEKCQRTFSTAVNMMKEFPEYKFITSQPQQFKFIKEQEPELFEDVKKMVESGNWEIEGAMWVEPDCNLPSGESLCRQLLHGKRFMKNEFGVDSKILWLPDVFGYSAALPQILKKAGVTRFVTSKISWNETNTLPCDVFMWQGIDGTEILSYFLTAQDYDPREKLRNGTTYNGDINARQIRGTWERFQQKELSNEVINTFGYGDGGGGPTRQMMEMGRRLEKGIPGCPTVTFEKAGDFLDRMEESVKDNRFTPKWVGELYLEYHRGTYTSIAKNKKNNRKSEFLYENTELASLMSKILTGTEYPKAMLHEGWEKILLCQFHDVIPGSSIKEVYDDSDIIYADIMDKANAAKSASESAIAQSITTDGGLLVFNPNSFTASGLVETDAGKVWVENIPAKGYKVVDVPAVAEGVVACMDCRKIENDALSVKFDENWNIVSIYDKKADREVVKSGEVANLLTAYEDIPRAWDAWEITNYYTEKSWDLNEVSEVKVIRNGETAGFEITRPFQKSTVTQRITLDAHTGKIDFDNTIDWKNDHILLKTAFPTEITSDKATYDIQYGNVERPTHYNTSWEQAKFEVCAHKFADLSEYNYGVSILNDCKYGHDIHGGVIRLTLLKSATSPNPAADKEVHHFTYSIYPHSGDFRTAGTIQMAYQLNNPMTATPVAAQTGTLADSYSMISVDKENIFIESIKEAEDDDTIIVRLYDAFNTTTKATVKFGFDVAKVETATILEESEAEVAVNNNAVTLTVKPFEIVTLKVTRA